MLSGARILLGGRDRSGLEDLGVLASLKLLDDELLTALDLDLHAVGVDLEKSNLAAQIALCLFSRCSLGGALLCLRIVVEHLNGRAQD